VILPVEFFGSKQKQAQTVEGHGMSIDPMTRTAAELDFRTVKAARIRTPRDPRLVKLRDDYLSCRVNRHALDEWPEEAQRWRFYQTGRKDPVDVLEMRWMCRRCQSTLIVRMREDSGLAWRPSRYQYVADYKVKNPEGVSGPVPRQSSKLEWARRFLERNPLPQRQIGYLDVTGRVRPQPPQEPELWPPEEPGVNGGGSPGE
jgi:hypothetical protein